MWSRITLLPLTVGLFMVLGLSLGCQGGGQAGGQQGAQARVEKQAPKPEPKKPAPTAAQEEKEEEKKEKWRYDPTNKWDPFVQPKPQVGTTIPGPERYDLDNMLLLGVIRGSGMDGAFIKFPDGSDRIVRVGDILGRHRGTVKEIGEDYILVEEQYLSPQQPNDTFIIEKVLKMPE